MTQSRPSFPVGKLVLPIITLVLAVIALAVGAVMTASSIAGLNSSLAGAQPTAAEVYGGQSLIGVSGAILAAGIVGVLLSLAALAIVIALTPRPVEGLVVLDEDLDYDDLDDLDDAAPQVPVAPAVLGEPVSAAGTTPAEPVAAVPAETDSVAERTSATTHPAAGAPVTGLPVEATGDNVSDTPGESPAR